MSQFINKTDYDATVHREILDALTRQDDAILDIAEDRAIADMRSYLSGRYNVDELFAARENARHPLVLMMCLDIAVYHVYSAHNPQKIAQIRIDRYERAVKWMEAVRDGILQIDGAPLKEEEERASAYLTQSNRKRCNHF